MKNRTSRYDAAAKQIVADYKLSDIRGDALAASIFLSRELEDIDAHVDDVKYAQLRTLEFVQLKPGLEPLDERYTRRKRDFMGQKAKRSATPTDTAPLAWTKRDEESLEYHRYKQGYSFSRDELAKSAKYGMPLDRERAEAARALLAQSQDALLATGDSEVSMPGLLTLTGTLTNDTSAVLESGTAADALAYLNTFVTKMKVQTLSVEAVKRMVLPTSLYEWLRTTRSADHSDMTILEYFKRNAPGIEVLDWERLDDNTVDLYGNRCNGAASNKRKIIAGDFSLQNVRALMPIPSETLEPERKGESWVIDISSKVGGIDLVFPKALIYADIAAAP
jgi:hypothetical protein